MTMRQAIRHTARHAGILRDARGISMLEFALLMPIFLGTILAGLELSQYVIATQRMQRVTANMADLVAQSGTAIIGTSESQINDVLSATQYSAAPFDLQGKGRIIITAVQGQKDPSDGVVKNRKLWHRCIGNLTGRPNVLPGSIGSVVVLPRTRQLLEGEILIHAQTAYNYEPLTGISIAGIWDPNARYIDRIAEYRPRSRTFTTITADGSTVRDSCPTT